MKEKINKILCELHPEIDFSVNSENLVSDSIIDSFDIVQLISALEKEFSISISALDLVPDNFDSIDDICNLVNKYKS